MKGNKLFQGMKTSDENKEKSRVRMLGTHHSDESRVKMSQSAKNRVVQGMSGKEHSEETRKKLSLSFRKKEYIYKKSENPEKAHNKVKIILYKKDFSYLKIFESLKDCAEFLNCSHCRVSTCLNGREKSVCGHIVNRFNKQNLIEIVNRANEFKSIKNKKY